MMENYFILFCAILVHFTQSYKFDYSMKNDDGFAIDGVTDYEVVPVRHMQHKRSINDLTLQTKINGLNHEVYLKPTEGLLAGTETKIITATNGQNNVNYELIPNIMEKVFLTFYQDHKTASSITHSVNKDGMSEFNGIINNNMVIRPMPNNVRKRRDLLKKSNPSFENEAEGFTNTTEHIIYKQIFNNSSTSGGVVDDKMGIKRVSRRSAAHTPDIVYPEIMVFVDDVLFKKFNYDAIKAVEYTLSFWNSVDLRYREFEKPKIRLNIAGIVLIKEPLSFINDATHNFPAGLADKEVLLQGFAQFLASDQIIIPKRDYDISILITGRDILQIENNDKSVAGVAFVSGVCKYLNNKYLSSGVVEDGNGYGGLIIATHELGHILGAPHDEEEETSYSSDTTRCRKEEGYIMSYNRFNRNRILFSPCSKEAIVFTLSQNTAECIRNNPAEYRNNGQIVRVLPGQLVSLDEQCQSIGYTKVKLKRTTCLELHCDLGNTEWTRHMPPAEGSPCGQGKYCLDGECVNMVGSFSQRQNPQTIIKAPEPNTYAPKEPTTKAPNTNFQQTYKTKTCINGKCTETVTHNNNGNNNNFQNVFKNFPGFNFQKSFSWKF